jgi:uncharacterized protein YecT (DUF1311 family)
MRSSALGFLLIAMASTCVTAQTEPHDITPAQLRAITALPSTEAIHQRQLHKAPLRAAYERQIASEDKDCLAEARQGQQPYNICMGRAEDRANQDFAEFYEHLQRLCWNESQLSALQSSERSWKRYEINAIHAAEVNWSDGTGRSGFLSQVHLSLLRDRMKELYQVYGLNIAQ